MISSRTIKPVDDVRLATGEVLLETKSIVTFSTSEMVTVGWSIWWLLLSSYHRGRKANRIGGNVCESERSRYGGR